MVMASDFEDSFDNDITNRSSDSGSKNDGTGKKGVSVFSLQYYQSFFDVDTNTVKQRILTLCTIFIITFFLHKLTLTANARSHFSSGIPNRDSEAMRKIIKNPDLYGPFWIVVTLIFAIAVSGNVADFLRNHTNHQWHYNFHLLSIAATIIISYVILVPTTLWATLQWTKKGELVDDATMDEDEEVGADAVPLAPNLLALICCYGYSLAFYIPVSLLWTVQVPFIQWVLMLGTSVSSGFALLKLLRSSFTKSKYGFGLTISVVVLHFLLAAGLMFYFFHGSAADVANLPPIVVDPPKAPAATLDGTNKTN